MEKGMVTLVLDAVIMRIIAKAPIDGLVSACSRHPSLMHYYSLFLSFKWIHIHGLCDLSRLILPIRLQNLLPLYPVPPNRSTTTRYWYALSRVELHY